MDGCIMQPCCCCCYLIIIIPLPTCGGGSPNIRPYHPRRIYHALGRLWFWPASNEGEARGRCAAARSVYSNFARFFRPVRPVQRLPRERCSQRHIVCFFSNFPSSSSSSPARFAKHAHEHPKKRLHSRAPCHRGTRDGPWLTAVLTT